jgi:hypothetical protein
MAGQTWDEALKRERRTNRRLRAVIHELREQGQMNRRDLDLQFARLAQLQVEVDSLKKRNGPVKGSGETGSTDPDVVGRRTRKSINARDTR